MYTHFFFSCSLCVEFQYLLFGSHKIALKFVFRVIEQKKRKSYCFALLCTFVCVYICIKKNENQCRIYTHKKMTEKKTNEKKKISSANGYGTYIRTINTAAVNVFEMPFQAVIKSKNREKLCALLCSMRGNVEVSLSDPPKVLTFFLFVRLLLRFDSLRGFNVAAAVEQYIFRLPHFWLTKTYSYRGRQQYYASPPLPKTLFLSNLFEKWLSLFHMKNDVFFTSAGKFLLGPGYCVYMRLRFLRVNFITLPFSLLFPLLCAGCELNWSIFLVCAWARARSRERVSHKIEEKVHFCCAISIITQYLNMNSVSDTNIGCFLWYTHKHKLNLIGIGP